MTAESTQTTIAGAVARIASIPIPAADTDIYQQGFASTDALELLVELEELFGVQIADDQFIEARTVAALARLVTPEHQEGV